MRDFAVNDSALPAGVIDSPPLQRLISLIRGDPSARMVVIGFSDCTGSAAENAAVRRGREQAILAAMPSDVQAKRWFGALPNPTTIYADSNLTAAGRARNRSVRVVFASGLWPSQGGDACDRVRRAANLDEYLFLVRCMERRLGLGTPAQAPTALSVLRQIYYGAAAWSSSRTSVWSDVITGPPWAPGNDPGPRLGAVMPALRAGQVVEATDVGHILTGIDAMLNPHEVVLSFGSRVQVQLPTGVRNDEWATWAGDVGSAAAEWAADQYRLSSRGNLDFYFRSFADPDDLYGDIDAFAIRAGLTGAAPARQLGSVMRLRGCEFFTSGPQSARADDWRQPEAKYAECMS